MHFPKNQQQRKIAFYTRVFLEKLLIPDAYFRERLNAKLALLDSLGPERQSSLIDRVNYYHPLNDPFEIPESALSLDNIPKNHTTYYFDLRRTMRHFPKSCRVAFRFGDVSDVSEYPRLVKARPLGRQNTTSILMRFNSIRHFRPITDRLPFRAKKNKVVWRGKVNRDRRRLLNTELFHHPQCDFGITNKSTSEELQPFVKPFLSVNDQLKSKFILSIEGNDVATNLKWISQSNSLCFMKKPTVESWFMEGTLEPGFHYVELKDDFSDLPEKIDYYLSHPEEAESIIANFQAYHQRFLQGDIEELLGLLVLNKHFILSGQIAD